MEERPATWKKLSAISQASANPGSMAVKMQRSYHLNDEDETEVEIENVAKGKSRRNKHYTFICRGFHRLPYYAVSQT